MPYLLQLDRDGLVCGGHATLGDPKDFLKHLQRLPNPPLPPEDIAWHNGEQWRHEDVHTPPMTPEAT